MPSRRLRRLDAPLVWVHPGGDPTPFTSLGPYQSRILANMNLVANEVHFVCTKKGWYSGYIHVLLDKLEVHLWTAFIYCHVSVHALLELCNPTVGHCGTLTVGDSVGQGPATAIFRLIKSNSSFSSVEEEQV